ncbi:MAG: TerC family protein [Phycisphaerales bacterium JB037]
MEELLTFQAAAALATLTLMEIVLGIDNVVFLAILTGKLPEEQRNKAMRIGLALAMGARIGLLFLASWLITLDHTEVFTLFAEPVTVKDLVLIAGGLFLLYKGTHEIHKKLEGPSEAALQAKKASGDFGSVLAQVVVMDMVFSVDSVITAVGMARHIVIMVVAVVISIGVMMVFARPISSFVERHPTTKMLALSFLMLIGVTLVVEGAAPHGQGIERGYIYAAMGFSLLVEVLNLRASKARRRRAGVAPAPSGSEDASDD